MSMSPPYSEMLSQDNDASLPASGRNVFTVSALNQQLRLLLDQHFPTLWVEGELSNVVRPNSQHLYFTLKDKNAQIRCVMFRHRNQYLRFEPENGQQIVLRANLSVYEARGDVQLIAEHMEPAGDGALQRAFEALKHRLAKEGLFDIERKQPLPRWPRQIGVITSATGAAVRDIVTVLKRRCPAIPVLIYPTSVQGEQAAPEIVKALERANQQASCDVLILARGGGSLEDLWPFNEEIVARAIAASHIPIVSGVGHEVDVTIADFVADQRAPTPSAAAELLSPDTYACLQQLDDMNRRLTRIMHQLISERRHALIHLQRQLKHLLPLPQWRHQLELLTAKLYRSIQEPLAAQRMQLAKLASTLQAVSPLATLSRGYAVLTSPKNHVVTDTQACKVGEQLTAQLHRGRLRCEIKEIVEA